MTLIDPCCVYSSEQAKQKMCQSSAPSLKALVPLVLSLMFSHVTCQGFIPEINSFNPQPPSANRRGLVCRVETGTGFDEPVLNTEFYLNGSDVRNELTGSDFEASTGEIIFDMTPELEGCYTCGNGTYRSSEEEALTLVCKAIHTTYIVHLQLQKYIYTLILYPIEIVNVLHKSHYLPPF